MFKNDYQGGPYFEIFSVQGNQPLSKLKVSGPESSVRTKFDKDLRTFTLNLEGESTTTKNSIPKTNKQSLHLTQQFLVFQIFIFPGKSFSLEVSLTDKSNHKQRIILSSNHREVVISSLHVKMPCAIIRTNTWLNLCLDIEGLLSNLIDGWQLQTIDSTVVSANCKLKRIFTLKSNPHAALGIPETLLLRGENTSTQVVDMDAFIDAGINIRSGTGNASSKRHPSYKSPSTRKKDPVLTSKLQRNSESGFIPKLRRSDSRNRSESMSSADEKDSFDHGMTTKAAVDTKNDFSCCGTAMTMTKLPKITQEQESSRPRIVKSAEYMKSRANHEMTQQNSKKMSLSDDATRDSRRLSDISHASAYVKKRLQDMQAFVRPVSKLKKIHSKSTMELPKISSHDMEAKPLFKSQSLQVLPSIRRESTSSVTSTNYRTGKRIASMENLIANPVVNLISPPDHDGHRDSLTLGDDKMVDDYLQQQISNGEEESISVSSSGCATSSGSDLFLYTSSPHSVCQQMDGGEQQTPVNDDMNRKSPSDELTAVDNNDNIPPSFSGFRNSDYRHARGAEYAAAREEKPCMSLALESITTPDLERNDDDDSDSNNSTGNNPGDYPVSSSPTSGNLGYNRYESYFADSLNGEFIPAILQQQEEEEEEESCCEDSLDERSERNNNIPDTPKAIASCMNKAKLCRSPNTTNHVPTTTATLHCIKNSFTVRESTDSDTMSWLNTSVDQSICGTDRRAVTNKVAAAKSKTSPRMILQKRIEETLGSLINQSVDNADDAFSDSSDDGSTNREIPRKVKNYRYQDEMKSINCTLDLSATIPATPPVGDQMSYGRDENNNFSDSNGRHKEELLNLLFDPVLNCYYDPRTQKYYELS